MRALLLAGCGIFGSVIALAGVMSSWERYETESWVMREAVVTKSLLSYSLGRKGKSWYSAIFVRFIDDGEEVPVAVAYGRWLGWNEQIKHAAEADGARYPVGRVVPVYHAPNDSKRAILERHSWLERIFMLPLGLAMLAIPCRYLWLSEKERRSTDNK